MLSGRDASGSALTDGFAVGVTLLVVLTNRVPFDIFTECEEEREEEFEDIDAAILADPTAGGLRTRRAWSSRWCGREAQASAIKAS